MIFIGAAGDAKHRSSGVRIPVRRSQTHKCRHHIKAEGIFDGHGHCLRIGGIFEDSHLIAQPLNRGSANKYRTFKGVVHLAVQTPGHGRNQPVIRIYRSVSSIHQ